MDNWFAYNGSCLWYWYRFRYDYCMRAKSNIRQCLTLLWKWTNEFLVSVNSNCNLNLDLYLDKFFHQHPIYIRVDMYIYTILAYFRRYPYTNCTSCELRIHWHHHTFYCSHSNGNRIHKNTDTTPNSCCIFDGIDQECLCTHPHQRIPCHRD